MPQPHNVIAIVYDYDRTLSPTSMQDDVLFTQIGINGKQFWSEVEFLKESKAYDDELAWIRLLLENSKFRRLSNCKLGNLGENLQFYPGIPSIFDSLNKILSDKEYTSYGIHLEHYIVTSGLKAILNGSILSSHVRSIFGCELDEDPDGNICWPKRVVSHTGKTQYLFRITKGLDYLDLSRDVNDHMPDDERRIPFRNMIYIGDGPTDVPCFAVITSRGGKALAVYNPLSLASFKTCMGLREAKRVDEIAEADYRPNTHLHRLLTHMVTQIADRIVEDRDCQKKSKIIEAPTHT